VTGVPYIVVYTIADRAEEVSLVGIFHGSRDRRD
jgi:hypothetical protein